MNTQYVCDHRLLIRDIYVGEAGSVHDSRVFRRSPLSRALLEDETMISFDEHILGDGGYILTNSVLIPYRNNGRLTPLQLNYNRTHAQIRVRVENCNARLKMKWRRTKYLHAMHQEVVVDHILSSAVLHNFIILNEEGLIDLDEEVAQLINEEEIEEDLDDLADPDFQYPNVRDEPDHHLLDEARQLGIEKRLHVMHHLPRVYA